jgi:hypothetical protein
MGGATRPAPSRRTPDATLHMDALEFATWSGVGVVQAGYTTTSSVTADSPTTCSPSPPRSTATDRATRPAPPAQLGVLPAGVDTALTVAGAADLGVFAQVVCHERDGSTAERHRAIWRILGPKRVGAQSLGRSTPLPAGPADDSGHSSISGTGGDLLSNTTRLEAWPWQTRRSNQRRRSKRPPCGRRVR